MASSSQEAASTTPISAEGAPRRKRPPARATAAHLQIPALLPARRIPARTARTKTRRRTHSIRPATCAGSLVCGPALSFANPSGSNEPVSAPDAPCMRKSLTCIRRGPHAWQRRVVHTASPGRPHGNAGSPARPRQGNFNFWALQRHTRKYHSEDRKKTPGRLLAFSHVRA